MRQTTQVLVVMIQEEKEYTRFDLVEKSNLTLSQVSNTLKFLRDCNLIKRRYIKTKIKPYRRALYSLNPDKYEGIIKLVSREVDIV